MILCWGVNHTVASVAQREQVAVPKGLLARWLMTCRAAELAEVVILSTCNRTEIYAVCAGDELESAQRCVAHAVEQCAPQAAAVLHEIGYWHVGDAAVRHLFRVASSLDAMVVGEPQILGQVKQAYDAACAVGAVGPQCHHVFQRAFRAAKRVREQTGLGERPVSIGSVAVALATQLFGDLSRCRALVLGSGEMGTEVGQYLRAAEIGHLAISGRNGERLTALAERTAATVVPWTSWPAQLGDIDIVICSTAATQPVMTRVHVDAARRGREARPLFLIDLALPRNIESDCADGTAVYLYDLDDLKAIAEQNLDARRAAVDTAEGLVAAMAESAWNTLQSAHRGVLSSLHQKCEMIRQQEVSRTLQQLGGHDMAIAQALDCCTHAIVAKMLHDPIVAVKADDPAPIEWLRRLFRLA